MKPFLLPLCLALASCTGLSPVHSSGSAPVQATSDRIVIEGARGLALANLAYQTVGTAAAIGIERGVITGATKEQVKELSREITAALVDGQRKLTTADRTASAAAALASIDKLCGLHPWLQRACEAVKEK